MWRVQERLAVFRNRGRRRTICSGYSNLGFSFMLGMRGCQTVYCRYDPEGIRTPDLHRDKVAC